MYIKIVGRSSVRIIVEKYNGRLYLAKDSRMSAELFKSTYKNWSTFQPFKQQIDTANLFSSVQSNRLEMND